MMRTALPLELMYLHTPKMDDQQISPGKDFVRDHCRPWGEARNSGEGQLKAN